ncbi:MAG: hypothetical protein CVV34_00120, partial [Methanomicrobiales archaeon HGW-Methanomicrobiales-5]
MEAKAEGNSLIYVTTSNGIQRIINVEVYVPLDGVELQIESPAQNHNIANRVVVTTPEQYQLLQSAILAVGAGIQMNVAKYPTDASVVSVTYQSSNTAIATINNNGYILARAIGTTTITVTVVSREFENSQTSTTKTTVKSFELSTYVPIKQINLNAVQVELYEENSLGYFDLNKAKYQFAVAITPSNATFNQQNINWSTSHPQYITYENGLVVVNIPPSVNLPNNSLIATITASIQEYGRYYSKTAVITIRRAVKVDSISVLNVPLGYVYFDAREGMLSAGTRQLSVQTYPYTATNSKVRYVYVQDAGDQGALPVFSVNAQGVITPVRAGIAKLHVVAEDSFINENTYVRYNEVIVKVADGLSENTALELYSLNNVRAIDTQYELGLHYVLANNIDFLNQPFTPLGLIGGVVYPFTGSINGQFSYGSLERTYQIKGLSFEVTSAAQYYSGLIAQNNGTIKNLKIELANWNITTTNNDAISLGYFGGVSAINYGTIENVTVSISTAILNNAILQIANRTSYVGLIAAQNFGNIINSVAYGKFEVKEKSGILQTPLIYVGGMVGLNGVNGLVEGIFAPANKVLGLDVGETSYSNENVLYQKEGINAYPVINTSLLQNINNATGLAVGYNQGTINKLATDGVVTGVNNVGGVAGVNIGQITNSYSASRVIGKLRVGGLVGYATEGEVGAQQITSTITNNAVEIYDRKNTYEIADIAITGVNFVGGLIGYADALLTLEYNYVKSYVLRELDETYAGDIVLSYEDIDGVYVVGGLIGALNEVSNALSKNYVNANITTIAPQTSNNTRVLYAGGLIGHSFGNFNVNNSYSRGKVILPLTESVAGSIVGYVESAPSASISFIYSTTTVEAETTNNLAGHVVVGSTLNILNDNYLVWDFATSTIWYRHANINDGYPVLYNNQENLLINEAPQEVNVIILDSEIVENELTGHISFNHLKVSNKQAVVLLKEQPYLIRGLIATSPNSARYYLTTTNTDIVEILEDGSIRTLKEGTATIRVSSVLNKNIFDTFELAVIKGFTNFSLSKTQGTNIEQLSLDNVINLKLNESVVLYSSYINNVGAVGNLVGATYTAPAGGFTVNNLSLSATLNNISTHIITAGNVPSLGNVLVSVVPNYKITFGDGEILLPINELRKQFYVSIYEGASSITTSIVSATIGLKEELELEVYVVTDKSSEVINLSYGQLEQDEEDNIENYVELVAVGSGVRILDDEDNYLYTLYRYTVKAQPNFLNNNLGSGNFKSAKSANITFVPESNLDVLTNFHITITPQDLLRIDVAHYPTGETQIEAGKAVYYPRELPSNIIAPSQPGILKINLYPEYANIDYYRIVSSVNQQGQFVSLEQVALMNNINAGVVDNVSYSAVIPSPQGIPYGTTLNLISNTDIENGIITNTFNGNIFVRTLISSAVVKGQTFTLTITGFRTDEAGVSHAQLSKQITLTVDSLPGITLLYKGERTGYVERGTRVPLELYISDEYSGVLREPVATYVYSDQGDVNEFDGASKHIYVEEDATIKGKFYLVIGHGIPSGTTIKVTAKVERTINGVLEERESTIDLVAVNFLISRIVIENTVTAGAQNTMNMYVGERTQFLVSLKSELWQEMWSKTKLDTLYGPIDHEYLPASEERIQLEAIKNEILEEIEYLQKMFSRNMNTWYERTGANLQIKTGLEENSYANYLIYRNINSNAEEGEYAYIGQRDVFIGARKVSNNSVLGAEIKYYYDEGGHIQPVLLQNNAWVKYPQVNQVEDMSQAIIMAEDIQKLKTNDFYFYLNVSPNSTEDKPVPIYDEQDFKNMQAGIDYILLNTQPLVLENWVPLNTAIKSLDGNNRVIKIKSFASNVTQGNVNFGLFGTINENTVLKNIKLDIGELVNAGGVISATEFNEVNFGFIAGVNYGTINNADVFNSSSASAAITINTNESANVTYGSLVAHNLGGYITNSRVGRMDVANMYPISIKIKGVIGGFVGYNTGVITSSYVANLTLQNTSLVLQNSKTGGFAATNSNRGRISLSFVEGIQASLGEAIQVTEQKVIQRGGIYSIGNIGGFIYENQGAIVDSYANIPVVTESRSAGFVYQNSITGVITNAYSLSKIAERSLAHLPFVGNNSLEQLLNFGTLTNTYYIANVDYFTSQFGDEYKAVAVSDFSYGSNFNGFGFLNEIGYEKHGAWEISSSYTRPVIPSALQVTSSERMLVDTRKIGDVIVEFFYTEVDYTPPKGMDDNPILV